MSSEVGRQVIREGGRSSERVEGHQTETGESSSERWREGGSAYFKNAPV